MSGSDRLTLPQWIGFLYVNCQNFMFLLVWPRGIMIEQSGS